MVRSNVVRFISPQKNLLIHMENRKRVDGVWIPSKVVQFVDGNYETDDKDIINFLRQCKKMGTRMGIVELKGGNPLPIEPPVVREGTMTTETMRNESDGVCDVCGKEGLKNIGAHKLMAHPVSPKDTSL